MRRQRSAACILALILARAAWAGSLASLLQSALPPVAAQHPMNAAIAGQVALAGYDLDTTNVAQGGELHVRLYWQALQPLAQDYASYVQLIAGPNHRAFAGSDHQHPGNVPSSTWPTSKYVIDDHYIPIPPDAPPLSYQIEAGLYRDGKGARLGQVTLPETAYVTERSPIRLSDIPAVSPIQFSSGIRLIGQRTVTDTDSVTVTLYWQASDHPSADYQVFIHGVSGDGESLVQADGPPLGGLYPTSQWRPGQVIADVHGFPMPAGSQARLAELQVGLYDLTSGRRLPIASASGNQTTKDAVRADNDAVVIRLTD